MGSKFYTVKDEFVEFAMEELKKLGRKMDQNFKSGIDHLVEKCENFGRFPFIDKEKIQFEEESNLLKKQFDKLEQAISFKSLDSNLTFLARLEDFCRIVKPNGRFEIPKTLDLDKARDNYKAGDIIMEEDYEYSDGENDSDKARNSNSSDKQIEFDGDPWGEEANDNLYMPQSNVRSKHSEYMKQREALAPPIVIDLPCDQDDDTRMGTNNIFSQYQRNSEVLFFVKSKQNYN